MRHALAALLLGALIGAAPRPSDDDFVVIVAAANPATSIRRQELARLFLKKTARWGDGREVMPVDLSVNSGVRNAFTRAVLSVEGMDRISAVQNFWLQQVYSGRGNPPPVKNAEADVVQFVAANPGAIGYVSAVPSGGAVKVLAVKE